MTGQQERSDHAAQSEFVRVAPDVPVKVCWDIFLSYGGLPGLKPAARRSTHTDSFKVNRGLCQLC